MASERGVHGETVTTTEARQGVTGHNVNIVLTVGTIGAIVCLALIWVYFF
jgi:hypothetical protein